MTTYNIQDELPDRVAAAVWYWVNWELYTFGSRYSGGITAREIARHSGYHEAEVREAIRRLQASKAGARQIRSNGAFERETIYIPW